jgi:aspartyl-tRNA(Asn)/glutamyl-tRNA(Gln) amidotransferase subunit B
VRGNRIVPLRDSWALEVQKQASALPAPPPAEKRAPKVVEEKVPEPLTGEELAQLEALRGELMPVIDGALAAHPAQVETYRGGKAGLLGFFIAQVMKQVAVGGGAKPSPKLVSVVMAERLGAG